MPPHGVVEAVDVAGNGLLGILPGLEARAPDELRLEGFEEGLDDGVIIAIALARH